MRIVIVGAGIVGLSTARAARARGHDVVLIDSGSIPNPAAASWDAHRMIRYHYGDAIGYTRMVGAAFDAWDRLWADLGAVHFVDTGAIAIGEMPGDYADRTLETFRAVGQPHVVLGRAETQRLCPQYRLGPNAYGVLGGRGGPLFADQIVAGLADWLTRAGAELMPHCPAVAIDAAAASATLADGRTVAGDRIVVTAGAWAARLVPGFAELPVMRQALLYVTPPDHHAAAWATGPALVAHGDRGGYALPGVGGTDLKLGHGPHRRRASPDGGQNSPDGEAAAILAAFAPTLHDIDDYCPIRVQVGYYVMDGSRRFRIDGTDRMIAVGNCDGQMFKFGPLMGERIVATIDGDRTMEELVAWAAGR